MIPSVTVAEFTETPTTGPDSVRRGRVRLGSQATPCEAVVLSSWDGERRPYAAGDRVLVVVSEGGDINAGVYVVARFVAEQEPPANSEGAHVIRAPRGRRLFLAPDDEGSAPVVLGDARPSGWGNDGIALIGPVEQHLQYLQDQIDALVPVLDAVTIPPGGATAALVPVLVNPPDALDWVAGAVGVTGGNA